MKSWSRFIAVAVLGITLLSVQGFAQTTVLRGSAPLPPRAGFDRNYDYGRDRNFDANFDRRYDTSGIDRNYNRNYDTTGFNRRFDRP
jgi:hypothetical protein